MAIETERLILTVWNPSDWQSFRPIASDPDVMRYINDGQPWSDDRIKTFVQRQIELYNERSFCRWKLLEKTTEQVIGFCGIGFWMSNPDPEIGWWLAKEKWNRGLATEAARAALHDALERVHLTRIISVARPENHASVRIMEKLGMRCDESFEWAGRRLVRYALNAPVTPSF